ncbi:MAG TPA: hypothetical protein VEK08_11290 [Planctomycetota bacterium]|nr:hypothetical protein [Planctomycetota bacterium]
MRWHCALLIVVLVASSMRAQEQTSAGAAPVYNISLLTDSAPDFTDIQSYLRSITSQFDTPQEKAINIFRWSQRLRKQTSYPTEDGHEVLDPIFFFTSYGYTMCGIISGIDNSLWLNMGWKAHYVQLGDHTVCETSWDDGNTWHMFDNSTSIYCFNDRNEIASVREIERNPLFYLQNVPPALGTNPVKDISDHNGWRWGADHPVENRRTLANGVDSFKAPNEILEDHLATRWGRRYVINLRPGEHYTRYFKNLDTDNPDPRYYRPLHGKDVEGKHNKNIRASGVWQYQVDFKDPAAQQQIFSASGVKWTPDGVRGPGSVVLKVSAANVVTSAKILLSGSGLKASVSRMAGTRWDPINLTNGNAQLVDEVAGVTQYLLKVELDESGVLSRAQIETITQINRTSLPPFRVGRIRSSCASANKPIHCCSRLAF